MYFESAYASLTSEVKSVFNSDNVYQWAYNVISSLNNVPDTAFVVNSASKYQASNSFTSSASTNVGNSVGIAVNSSAIAGASPTSVTYVIENFSTSATTVTIKSLVTSVPVTVNVTVTSPASVVSTADNV